MKNDKKFSQFLILLSLFCFFPNQFIARANEPNQIGYICDSSDNWMQNGVKIKKAAGEPVLANATIEIDTHNKTDRKNTFIIIHLYTGSRIERSIDTDNLSQPIQIELTVQKNTQLNRLFQAVGKLFHDRPNEFEVTMSRGVPTFKVRESVAMLKNETINLAPLFDEVPPGRYNVIFRKIQNKLSKDNANYNMAINIDWNHRAEYIVSAHGFTPGIYKMDLLSAQNKVLVSDVWILFCNAKHYTEISTGFRNLAKITDGWGTAANASEVRGVLRAALVELATSK